jgi:hypothetical protein
MKTFTLGLLTLAILSLNAAENPAFVTISLEQTGGRALESYGVESAWAVIPTGHWPYDGVPFNVMTKLQLHGDGNARENRFYPARVMGIPVRQRLARLHLLHGGDFTEHPNSRPIASVRVNYAGGSNYTFMISYGVHVRTWRKGRGSNDTVTDPNSSVVWTGRSEDGDKANVTHRLYKSSFNLPSGMVESIDLFSLFGTSSEVILAMTGEAPGPSVLPAIASADDSKYRDSIVVKIAGQSGESILGAGVRGTAVTERDTGTTSGSVIATLGRMENTAGEPGVVAVDFPARTRELRLSAQAKKFVPEAITLTRGTNGKFRSEISARLAPGIRIGGVVQDPGGRPLAKAKVEIVRAFPSSYWFKYDEITTDEQGRWSTHEVPESLYNLRFQVTHASFHRGRYDFQGENGDGGLTRSALLGNQAAFQLERKIDLAGTLRDESGRALTNVTIWLMHGSSGSGWRTDRRGAFTLKDVEHAPCILKVEDPNFAPLLMPFDPTQEKGPLKLILTAGTPLRGQFFERVSTNSPETRPVPGLSLTVAVTRENDEMLRWTGKADAEGRFEWPHAPEGALRVLAWGPSRNQRSFTARAGQDEAKFDMSPIVIWHGIVQDEETKEAVTNVTATPGYRNGDERWGWLPYLAVRGPTGQFTFHDRKQWGFMKIEAPGYQPRAVPIFDGGESSTNLFALRRADVVKGVVKLPDGLPAPGAQVAVIGETLFILGQGKITLQRQSASDLSLSATTDNEGRFELPPHFQQRVVVVHSAGYAETTLSNLAVHAEIKLEPFGTIEGVLLEGRQPVSNGVVQLEATFNTFGLSYDSNFTARTDAQGRFRFTHVPPGTRWLGRKVETQLPNSVWSHRTPVAIAPGASVQANIGGTGRAVISQLVVPADVMIDWKRSSFQIFSTLQMPTFRTAEEQRAWQITSEAQEYRAGGRPYAVLVRADGLLRAEDLPPGRYRLQSSLYAPPAPGASANSYGKYIQSPPSREFVIDPPPGGRSDQPLDLGPVEIPKQR